MKLCISAAQRAVMAGLSLLILMSAAAAQQPAAGAQFVVKPVAEKKISQLPPGPWYWLVENFPTLAQAQAAAGPTSLAVDVAGKTWLFTLGPKGGSTPGATKVTEIGPVPLSRRPSTCCASTTPADRPEPRRRCILIPALRLSMS
jgi:hypothetical protein